MPRLNRSDTFYVGLPDKLATPSVPDAKMAISVTMTVPKGMEKVAQKIIMDAMAEAKDVFKARMKKAVNKAEQEEW